MAVEYGDRASGFQHIEVVRFINNEVLMNGGGPEFYMTLRSRPWSEVEDRLRAILVDPMLSRSHKRAYTWSALALSVRMIARHREQQSRRVGRLQGQVGERETASRTLVSELHRLRDERDQAAAQLLSTQVALQQAMDEREVLRGRLLQAERSARADTFHQDVITERRMGQPRTVSWSMDKQNQVEVNYWGQQNIPHLGVQVPAPATLPYPSGAPSPFTQTACPILQMPRPSPIPINAPTSMRFPYSTPGSCPVTVAYPVVACPAVTESRTTGAERASVLSQVSPVGRYPSRLTVAMRPKEAMGQGRCHQGDNRNYSQVDPVKTQRTSAAGDTSYNRFKKDQVMPQKIATSRNNTRNTEKKGGVVQQKTSALKINTSHKVKEDSVMPQGMSAQGNSTNQTIKEDPVMPHRMATQIQSRMATRSSHKNYPVFPQGKVDPGYGARQSQKENPKMSPGTEVLGAGRRQSQKHCLVRSQESPLGKSKSHYVNKCQKKQSSTKKKIKPRQETKTTESKQQEKPTSHRPPMNWVCPSCKAVNRSRRKACYKCTKVCIPTENGNVNSEQTH